MDSDRRTSVDQDVLEEQTNTCLQLGFKPEVPLRIVCATCEMGNRRNVGYGAVVAIVYILSDRARLFFGINTINLIMSIKNQ